jgi:hypothetical protein
MRRETDSTAVIREGTHSLKADICACVTQPLYEGRMIASLFPGLSSGPGRYDRCAPVARCPTGKSVNPVQPHLQKYFWSRLTQITSIAPAVSSPRGAYRDRHGRGMGCGGRGSVGRVRGLQGRLSWACERTKRARTNGANAERRSRVVLAPVAGAKSAEASRPDRV